MKYIKEILFVLSFALCVTHGNADAQTVCPGVDHPEGWFRMDLQYPDEDPGAGVFTDFTAGLYGSIDVVDNNVSGDLDWLYNDASETFQAGTGTNTTHSANSQVVAWWTQRNSRNTYVQFTNGRVIEGQGEALGTDPFGNPIPLGVHVQVYGEDCLEIINYCDFYTPKDTHVYNLGDLVTNAGQSIGTNTLQGREGFITITPVVNCGTDDRAIRFFDFYATVRIIDTANDVDYGVNAWQRDTVVDGMCTNIGTQNGSEEPGGVASILDGTNCFHRPVEPSVLSQNFAAIGAGFPSTGTDLVLFSFQDIYNDNPEIGYQAAPATAVYNPDIFDDQENLISCPQQNVCFTRLGVNDVNPISEDFVAPTPEPTPTPTPEPTPTPTPDPGDTTGGDSGDGGGCTVAPAVTASTAAVNFLLPLLPLAGAYGIRRFRKYKSKID